MNRTTAAPLLLVALAALVACSSLARAYRPVPGYGVSDAMLDSAECDRERYENAVEVYRSGGDYAMPRVGDSLCMIWAKLGVPNDSRTVQHEGGSFIHYVYETGSAQTRDLRLHTLTFDCRSVSEDCTVDIVNW